MGPRALRGAAVLLCEGAVGTGGGFVPSSLPVGRSRAGETRPCCKVLER